jgi:AraC-like DNA-binding protein
MRIQGAYDVIPKDEERSYRVPYLQIQEMFDIGFYSTFEDGIDHHHVTRDITVSMQQFHDNELTNILFQQGNPLRIRLTEEDVASYYSDYLEWRFILEGHFEMEIDGELAGFEENELCFLNSSALHREIIKGSECTIINFNINRSFFNERFISSISVSPLQKFLRGNLLQLGMNEKYLKFVPAGDILEEIKESVFTILNEGKLQLPGYQDICRGHIIRLTDFLSASFRHELSQRDAPRYYETLFDSVAEYMKKHASGLRMQDLIRVFHYQSNFLNNLIKQFTGLTYSDYLVSLRIDRAKELLETTDLPVEEIIFLVGYHNRGFFYKKFTQTTGVSPLQYRLSRS